MSKKRLSLAELMSEDEKLAAVADAAPAKSTIAIVAEPTPISPATEVAQPAKIAKAPGAPKVEVEESARTMKKLSVTLPSDMHDAILDLSLARRRAGQPYQLSQIVREAMSAWLSEQGA